MSAHQSLEAEESVLGGMLLAPKAIEAVIGVVTADEFYRDSHGVLFREMIAMHSEGEEVDPVTVASRLERIGQLAKVGGAARLSELAASTPSARAAGRHAQIVKEKAVLRGLKVAGMEIGLLADEGQGSPDELLAQAEEFLSQAVARNNTEQSESIATGLDELVAEWRLAYQTKVPVTGTMTRFTTLDSALHGFWPGQLILLAARPGVGKSTLAQNIAENMVDSGDSVLFFTLEMSRRELQTKGIARAGKIDTERLSSGQITEEEAAGLGRAIKIVEARKDGFVVHDSGAASLAVVTAEATRVARQGKLGLIVVDYIQLMQGQGETKAEQVGSISRGLKLLARRLNVPILALSQMNRAIIHRSDKRPDLSDLRDSGSLEQDADVVAFLHRDSDFDSSLLDDGTIEFIVAKNRRGKTGNHKLLFTGRYSAFHTPPPHVQVAVA